MITHQIDKGFDIPIAGVAEPTIEAAPESALAAVTPTEFAGIKPKALVKDGDSVVTGQPLYFDKRDPETMYCSPATGRVRAVELGERRFLNRIVIDVAGEDSWFDGPKIDADRLTALPREDIVAALKATGLWIQIRQRPLGRVADSTKVPSAIYVNAMDTEPLAADPTLCVQGRKDDVALGVRLLGRLTEGKVYLTTRGGAAPSADLAGIEGVETHAFAGPHPAGLVGTHIHKIQPLKSDEVAWTLDVQQVANLGHFVRTGHYPAHRVVAVAGSEAPAAKYFRVREGAHLSSVTGGSVLEGDVRMIGGTVLHGDVLQPDGYLPFYETTITCIPEGGDRRDFIGWILPKTDQVSASRSVWSWLKPKERYVMDARIHGGHRAMVNIGSMEAVMPLDIFPTYLVRAIQANDLEEALKLGLLEVTEEDVALCTFVDPCKTNVGPIVRKGLDMYESDF